jgi:predicted RNase H-related nuclease YkuK (DUF458 family)
MVSPTKGEMTVEEVVLDMKQYIAASNVPVEVVVGADSQNSNETKLVLVIAMCREGQGGRFFYSVKKLPLIKDLRTKIYAETQATLKLADELTTLMIDNEVYQNIIVHIDIGTVGKTKDLIAEIKGWVNAEGYEVYIKPQCYAASGIANAISK